MGQKQTIVIDSSIIDSKYIRIVDDKLSIPVIDSDNNRKLLELNLQTKKIKILSKYANHKRQSSKIIGISSPWSTNDSNNPE